MQMRVYKSCCHPVAAMILVMYVDNDGIRHNCEELVHEFEKSVKVDGRNNLQKEGELDWFLSVRYTYDKITGAIGCSQEAYIDRLLVKCGMEHANACKLPMNPGSDLDLLPVLDTPDKLVVHVFCSADWRTPLHCYQHRASAQSLHELSYSVHVQSDAGTSHLC